MEEHEAKRIVQIMITADGCCGYCGHKLLKEFVYYWPEFEHIAKEEFEKEFISWNEY